MSVGVDRPLRMILRNWNLFGNAITSAARGKDHWHGSESKQSLEKGGSACKIILVIEGRLLDRLADVTEGGKVHQRGGPVFLEHGAHARCIGNVALLERAPFHCPPIAPGKIVVGDGEVPCSCQSFAGMATDIAGSPCNQDVQWHVASIQGCLQNGPRTGSGNCRHSPVSDPLRKDRKGEPSERLRILCAPHADGPL